MTDNISSVEQLKEAICNYNPFNVPAIVKNQDIWGQGFPDIEKLNAHASDTILKAIKSVNYNSNITSMAMTADKGTGKSHIISRIRKLLQKENNSLFIYANASQFSDLNRVRYLFLQTIADSFSQVGNKKVSQWQELATGMLNRVLKKNIQPRSLVHNFPTLLSRNEDFITRLTNAIIQSNSDIIKNPYLVKAILWTLSKSHAPYAINWLAGNDLADKIAIEMGLPNIDRKQKELKALDTVRQILSLASKYNTLLICFDELEGTEISDNGCTKAQVIASELIKSIFDEITLPKDTKGIVILTAMLPDTWRHQVKILTGGVPERVSAITPVQLKHLDSELTLEIVKLWLRNYYSSHNLVPPHSVYPFQESKLKLLGKEKPTVRQLWEWCRNNWDIIPRPPVKPPYEKELIEVENSIAKWMEDKETIAAALKFGYSHVIGKTIENVAIEKIENIKPKRKNNGYIDFKIVGKEDGKTVKIGVSVIQQSNMRGVGAGLKRLIDYQTFDLTRGCLIRSKTVKSTTRAKEYLDRLLSEELGGELVKLTKEAIKPLLALLFVDRSREEYGITQKQIADFIEKEKLAAENYLICEILSDPAREIPEGLIDEENLVNEKLTEATTENIEDIDLEDIDNNLVA